jgi:hypothetical protein
MRDRQYTFSKITQFTLLNNKVDHLGSNIDGVLKRETVFFLSLEFSNFTKR